MTSSFMFNHDYMVRVVKKQCPDYGPFVMNDKGQACIYVYKDDPDDRKSETMKHVLNHDMQKALFEAYEKNCGPFEKKENVEVSSICSVLREQMVLKTNCARCGAEIELDNIRFCPFCGKKLGEAHHNIKKRGNGQGTVFKRGNKWAVSITLGWKLSEDGTKKTYPIKKQKSGFATKKEAMLYLTELYKAQNEPKHHTLDTLYSEWKTSYEGRVSEKTMEGYRQAFAYFKKIQYMKIETISASKLQECLDNCPKGKRTREVMRTIAGLLWKYAMSSGYLSNNAAANLYTGKGKSEQREPITQPELELIKSKIGVEPYADYIYCLCYLGFRPGEFLALKKEDFHEDNGITYLIGGSKTEAGTNRRVVIPQIILPIIKERLATPDTDLLFPMICHNRKGEFTGYKEMTHNYFNNFAFKPLMSKLGIEGKVPYSARHTYSDKLKQAAGDKKDKAALIGHTDYDFTQHRYQSSSLEDLAKVVDSIK